MIETVSEILSSIVSILLISGVIYCVTSSNSYDSELKKLEQRVTHLEACSTEIRKNECDVN